MTQPYRTYKYRLLNGHRWRTKLHEHNAYCVDGRHACVVGVSPGTADPESRISADFGVLHKRTVSVTPAPEAQPTRAGRAMFLVIYEQF